MKSLMVVANWKMYKTPDQAEEFCQKFRSLMNPWPSDVEVVICPTFLSIANVMKQAGEDDWQVGAQDGFWRAEGARTGDISMEMLRKVGVRYVLVGHSERRVHYGEGDDVVQRKVTAARHAGLTPIVCVGESLQEREAGKADLVVRQQIEKALAVVPTDKIADVVLAYEPVWSIGTGKAATAEDARSMVQTIRNILRQWGEDLQEKDLVRILYGGSVAPDNVQQYLEAGMNGVLVGRASLDPEGLQQLILAADRT